MFSEILCSRSEVLCGLFFSFVFCFIWNWAISGWILQVWPVCQHQGKEGRQERFQEILQVTFANEDDIVRLGQEPWEVFRLREEFHRNKHRLFKSQLWPIIVWGLEECLYLWSWEWFLEWWSSVFKAVTTSLTLASRGPCVPNSWI